VHAVHDQVLAWIDDPSRFSFDTLAHAVFAHQFESIEPYRRFCLSRDTGPADRRDIPAVPVGFSTSICAAARHNACSVVGTTQGPSRRSRSFARPAPLLASAALAGCVGFVPDVTCMPIVSLVDPLDLPLILVGTDDRPGIREIRQ
jgi:hypothetical protein